MLTVYQTFTWELSVLKIPSYTAPFLTLTSHVAPWEETKARLEVGVQGTVRLLQHDAEGSERRRRQQEGGEKEEEDTEKKGETERRRRRERSRKLRGKRHTGASNTHHHRGKDMEHPGIVVHTFKYLRTKHTYKYNTTGVQICSHG